MFEDTFSWSIETPLEEKLLGTAHEAKHNRMLLAPPAGNGQMKEEGKFMIDWDSKESMQAVRQRVDLLLKRCACEGGCSTKNVVARRMAYHVAQEADV